MQIFEELREYIHSRSFMVMPVSKGDGYVFISFSTICSLNPTARA
jgi:hypothetical protein